MSPPFFFIFSFIFPKAMPSLTSFLPISALQGWAPFPGSSRLWELCCYPCYQPCASADLQGEGWRTGRLYLFYSWLLRFRVLNLLGLL